MEDTLASINLYMDGEPVLMFTYPANNHRDLDILSQKLTEIKKATEHVAQSLIYLLSDVMAESDVAYSEMDTEDQQRLHMILCTLLKYVCEDEAEQPEAGKEYEFRIALDDEGMTAEVFVLQSVH